MGLTHVMYTNRIRVLSVEMFLMVYILDISLVKSRRCFISCTSNTGFIH
nr:hypothetical protein Q903MT_gene2294 [Picea sitchensis]